jgi:hypothetical protein
LRTHFIPAAGALALLLSACGGGGGSSSPAAAPLALSATTPANGATTGIDAPTLSFDAAPDMASVGTSTVTLSSSVGTVEARYSVSGNTVTVTPTASLVWGSHYQLSVSDAVRSAAGGKLAAAKSIGFDTRMPTWGEVGTIAGSGPQLINLQSGGAANGDTQVIWIDSANGSAPQVLASRFSAAGQRWSTPAVIQGNAHRAESPALDLNAAGVGIAIWEEAQDDGSYSVKAARVDASGNWGTPVAISKAGGASSRFGLPRVAVAPNGNAIAVWKQYASLNALDATIDTAYYDAASGQWSAARSMQSLNDTYFPTAAIAANGNAMLLWSEKSASGVMQPYAARYDAASKTWSANAALQANPANITYAMEIEIDGAGNAFALLKEDSTVGGHLYAARYSASANSWSKPEDLKSNDASQPQLRFDGAGNAMLLWSEYAGTFNIESRRYQQSTNSWTALPSQHYYVTTPLPMRMDAAGNVVTAWGSYSNSAVYTMNTMRYSAASGKWEAPQVLASRSGFIGDPVLTMDQSGQALLAWPSHTDGYYSDRNVAYARLTGK